MKIINGNLIGNEDKISIVVSRFNEFITAKLLSGAIDTLKRHGVDDDNIDVIYVPGAFEIPLISQKLAMTNKYSGIICLGSVIRGSTTHYDYVCNEVSKGISQLSQKYNLPIMFGVLTTENIEQAIERAGTKNGNKGSEVAIACLEMIDLMKNI